MEEKKKFSLFTTVLTVICVVFVAEAAAPVAAVVIFINCLFVTIRIDFS